MMQYLVKLYNPGKKIKHEVTCDDRDVCSFQFAGRVHAIIIIY